MRCQVRVETGYFKGGGYATYVHSLARCGAKRLRLRRLCGRGKGGGVRSMGGVTLFTPVTVAPQ